jgi:hypothetical protein
LKANIAVALVSKFKKTLMFRFKSLPYFNASINFAFSTYDGDSRSQNGFMIRIINSLIQVQFHGTNGVKGATNTLHNVYHAISGGTPVFFDNFVHMVVVLDHTDNFITSYINGVLNSSTNALVSGTTQTELDQGTFYGVGATTVPFYVNKWATFGEGNALWDDIKFFNNALTQEEVTHYYNESIE